jgi:hypothetical protein
MSEHTLSNRILAGALTFIALGLIWVAIVSSLPSEQELAAKEAPIVPRAVSKSLPEPTLDLSIPGVRATQPARVPLTTVAAEILVLPNYLDCGVKPKLNSSVPNLWMEPLANNALSSARRNCPCLVSIRCANAWSNGRKSGAASWPPVRSISSDFVP